MIIAISKATTGLPKNLKNSYVKLFASKNSIIIVEKPIIKTGDSEVNRLLVIEGNSLSLNFFVETNSLSGVAFTFFKNFVKIGPEIIIAGIAIINPYINVLPMSALNKIAKAVGAGWGGRYPWVTDKAHNIGRAIEIKGIPVDAATLKTRGIRITNPTE